MADTFCKLCWVSTGGEEIHMQCQQILYDQSRTELNGKIGLGYFRQGMDFDRQKEVDQSGKVDLLRSLELYHSLLTSGAYKLEQIADRLEEVDDPLKFTIKGMAHTIWFTGPTETMRKLILDGLVALNPPLY